MARTTLRRLVASFVVVAAAIVGPASEEFRPAKAGRYGPAGRDVTAGRYGTIRRYAFIQTVSAQQEEAGSRRAQSPLTILQINDVYSTVPVDGIGGLARVATLKRRISANGHPVIMVLAGDFLSPSVASSVFKGEQMIAALNAAGLDLATLGNHEFDFGRDILIQRMAESKFQWVVSNVVDTKTGKPIGGAAPYVLRDAGPLKVGFIGLCIKTPLPKDNQAGIRFIDPLVAAARYIPVLKRRGANVIVAITHLGFDEDRALVRRFPEIDLVVGGHEHYPITASENHALISKAGSEARWAARIDINRTATGTVERFYELIPITSAIVDDPQTAQTTAVYESRLGKELDQVVATSTVGLDATDRREIGESNLGNLFADALRADVGADIGLTNSGAIRGDRLYPAGPLTGRTLLAMHPFGNVNCEIEVTGRVLIAALNSGVSKLPGGSGQFPQVSGMTMKVNPRAPPGNRVTGVVVNGQPLEPDKTYTVALPDYVLKGGDNYTMFRNARVLVGPESGNLIVAALARYIAAKGTVSPGIEGRITTE
jgi:2',3'-cyclic-nucleotide 2'-phosphodiesterase (5'-nucleotidase family)